MGDEDARIRIAVVPVAETRDSNKVANELINSIDKQLPDGCVEVPIKLKTTDIKGASKELKQAQKDVISAWEKTFENGPVSDSVKDLEALLSAYNRFRSLANKENKNKSKTVQNIKSFMEPTVDSYKAVRPKQVKTRRPKTLTLNETTSQKTKRKRTAGTGAEISEEEILNNIKQRKHRITGIDKFSKNLYKGASRAKASAPGAEINLGVRQPGAGNSIYLVNEKGEVDERTVERSPYSTPSAVVERKEIAKARKRERKSLSVSSLSKETEEQALKNVALRESAGVNPYGTEYEIIKNALLNELALVQGGLVHGKDDVSAKDLIDQTLKTLSYDEQQGVNPVKSIFAIVNMLMNRYTSKGRVGATDGAIRGEGENQEEANEALKSVLSILQAYLDSHKELVNEILDIKNKASEKRSLTSRGSLYDKALLDIQASDSYKNMLKLLTPILSEDSDKTVADTVKEVVDTNEKILTQNKTEAVSERLADKQVNTANRKLIDETQEDARTGSNADANFNPLAKTVGDINKKVAANSVDYTSWLEAIMVILSSINQKLFEVFDPKSKKSIKISAKKSEDKSVSDKNEQITARTTERLSSMIPDWRGKPYTVSIEEVPENTTGVTSLTTAISQALKPLSYYDERSRKYKTEGQDETGLIKAFRNLPSPYILENGRFKQTEVVAHDNSKVVPEWLKSFVGESGGYRGARSVRQSHETERERAKQIKAHAEDLEFTAKTQLYTNTPKNTSVNPFDKIKDLFSNTSEAERALRRTAEEQKQLNAERANLFGLSNNGRPSSYGMNSAAEYNKIKYGFKKGFSDMDWLKNIKLTPDITMDTAEITQSLGDAISASMFKAQTGGFFKNLIGPMTMYLGQPSLEKSRAFIEGMNQILANTKNTADDILQSIMAKQTTLQGLRDKGNLYFRSDGTINKDMSTPEAVKLFADLEEDKLKLKSILADVGAMNIIVKSTHGNIYKSAKQLSFTSDLLRENNKILKYINTGYNKSGKVLQFQSRTAEILNYSFQYMARSIGQMWKNLLYSLNPINLIKKAVKAIVNLAKKLVTTIKQAFQDFASYDVKWQRTLNVIKYNFRAIIRPAMQWIAQSLTNVIGFFDIISMKIQNALGQIPISLFDQSAANAEKMREDLEASVSATAGFDEFHDISSESGSNSAASDLFGDIYTPQLSEEWTAFAEKIGDSIATLITNLDLKTKAKEIADAFTGLITGDLGFGDVMATVLSIAWDGIQQIWEWFSNTEFGQAIIDAWNSLLATMLKLFIGWELLKIGGTLLANALFGNLTLSGAFGTALSSLGSLIVKGLTAVLGGSAVINGIGAAFSTMFSKSSVSIISALKILATDSGVLAEAGALGSTIAYTITNALVAGLAIFGTFALADFFGDKAVDNAAYNYGITTSGGSDDLKKSNTGNQLGGILGSAALGGLAGFKIGGGWGAAIGAAIGAIAGTIQTVLCPSLEAATLEFQLLNNEMASMSYYEGVVQGYSETVSSLNEVVSLSNSALTAQTEKVYALGETYGISTETLNALVQSMKEGNYTSSSAVGLNAELASALDQLAWHYTNNTELTNKLTEARKQLEKAELDLAITEDIAAGNFELAAARIEVAYASNVYTADEATKKMVQIAKEGSTEQAAAILQDLSPDLKAKLQNEYAITDEGISDLTDLVKDYSETGQDAVMSMFGQETQAAVQAGLNDITDEVNKHKNFWQAAWDVIKEIFTGGKATTWTFNGSQKAYESISAQSATSANGNGFAIAAYATGTNYVPSDGLAYLHQGEAVIPAKYNTPYQAGEMSAEEKTYLTRLTAIINKLDTTVSQGINIKGQFTQRGSDLVAVVNKTNAQTGATLLSNVAYAR